MNTRILTSLISSLVLVLSSSALAQPVNDTCAGAITIASNAGFPQVGPTQYVSTAVAAPESPFSCAATANASIWYRFTPAVSGTYVIGNCLTNQTLGDTVVAIYTGTCAGLTELTGGCNDDGCSTRSFVSIALTGGTDYFIQLAKKGATAPTILDTLQLSISTAASNDTCSTPTVLSVDRPVLTGLISGMVNDAQVGGAAACFTGVGQLSSTAAGRDSVFSFTPTTTGTYSVRIKTLPGSTSNSADIVAYLSDSCVAAMTPPQTYSPPQCIAATNRTGSSTGASEELACVSLTSGVPYFVWADQATDPTFPTVYEVEVNACFAETEPNNTTLAANTLSCPTTGFINVTSDVDFFQLGTLPADAKIFAFVDGISGGTGGSSTNDFDIRVTTATDTLEYDDTNVDVAFGSLSGMVAGVNAVAGQPHFVRVNHFSGTTSGTYRVYASVRTGTPIVEAEPNDTLANAVQGPTNYFSGDVTSTTDVDLYQFEARAGELIFAALDSTPVKTVSPASANHTLALLDESGNPLLSVNDAATSGSITTGAGSLTSSTPSFPGEGLVYRATRTGRYFMRVGRASTSGTGTYILSITFNCLASFGTPSVTTIAPNTGTVSGATSVTITGSNFGDTTQVFFGTTPVPVISRTATTLTINTPIGNVGPVDVIVANPGTPVSTTPGGFTYFEPVIPPTVTAVNPVIGPIAGGTSVTIDGTLFKANPEVTFTVGATTLPALNVVRVSVVRITATTPPMPAGLATVTVRNPVDSLQGSLTNGFEFLSAPTVTGVTPSTGFITGGQSVTVTGTGFRAGAVVRFGSTVGTGVVVDPGGTSLTVAIPVAAAAGAVQVSVTNADTQQGVLAAGFTYVLPPPLVANIAPTSGFTAGGQAITINGNNFFTGATVTIGGAAATNVVRVNATRLTASTPPGVSGTADVVVTNVDAQSSTLAAAFTYIASPVIASISPNHGPVQGGTVVTLTGTSFQPGMAFTLGGVPAFAVTVVNSTTATAVTNGAPPGSVTARVTNTDTQTGTLDNAFTFDAAPTLVTVSPITGSTAGGTMVTLTGTGFLAGATVLFGADESPAVTVVSPTSIRAESPPHAVGVVSMTVRNADNQFAELPRSYRFVAPPTLATVAPDEGDVTGGTVVTLTGTGFTPAATVTFDGVSAAVSYVSETELTATTPAHDSGEVDVVVTVDGVPATLTYGYTYTRGVPTLSVIAPASGGIAGGNSITLTGSGFAAGATITVGGAMATDVVVVSSVLARAVVPAHAAGAVDVVFTNDDMQSATLAGGYTYVLPPTGNTGVVADGGSGAIGTEPVGGGGGAGGVSCGCTSFDGSMISLGGFGLMLVLSRRRRRS